MDDRREDACARKATRLSRRALVSGLAAGAASLALIGCDKSTPKGVPISWHSGTPPSGPAESVPAVAAKTSPTPPPSAPTAASTASTGPVAPAASGSPPALTAAQLTKYQPNELAMIPVMEYHQIVTDPKLEAQFVRTADHFRQDLEWLYQHDYYIVPLLDVVLDQIAAPLGKHPVVLTFDDSTVGHFRFIKGSDGKQTIDPNCAVGIIEAMYAKHPDFGRGGIFFVISSAIFDWDGSGSYPDQTPLAQQKLQWLLDHDGYEIGDHTVTHPDLVDVSDDKFKAEVGGNIEQLHKLVPNAKIQLFALPDGGYPDKDKHPEQLDWLRNGFTYNGNEIKLLGSLNVGANPTPAPASTKWDPVFIPRIQAFNMSIHNEWGGLDTWFPEMEKLPHEFYISDGNPQTLTIPKDLDADGPQLDQTRVQGKTVIRY